MPEWCTGTGPQTTMCLFQFCRESAQLLVYRFEAGRVIGKHFSASSLEFRPCHEIGMHGIFEFSAWRVPFRKKTGPTTLRLWRCPGRGCKAEGPL
jgi:hypothetical protein